MSLIYWSASLAYLLQIILFVSLHFQGSYSLTSHAVSDYGVGATRRLFSIYGLVGVAAAILLGIVILVDGQFAALGGVYILAMAALRLGVLKFPTDLEGDRRTRKGTLHYLFAIGSFALAYMAIDALHPDALTVAPDWARGALDGLRWIVTGSLVAVVVFLIPALRRIFGLAERMSTAKAWRCGPCAPCPAQPGSAYGRYRYHLP